MVLDPSVTRRAINLGLRDATTGWRHIDFFDETIEAIRFSKGARYSLHSVGCYASEDAMFLTQDVATDGDQLLTLDGAYYEAVTVQEHWILDSFVFRDVQAHQLPMWQVSPSSTATWKTLPDDPRSRTKHWIDEYVRDASILKDDGVTQASWDCMFSDPPYPLRLEFRGASNMNGFYVVGQPNSAPEVGHDKYIIGYDERVPVHIVTVDSAGCSGHQLQWRMDAELRYVCETYPLGSLRTLNKRSSRDVMLGSMKLYDTEYELRYMRNKT